MEREQLRNLNLYDRQDLTRTEDARTALQRADEILTMSWADLASQAGLIVRPEYDVQDFRRLSAETKVSARAESVQYYRRLAIATYATTQVEMVRLPQNAALVDAGYQQEVAAQSTSS